MELENSVWERCMSSFHRLPTDRLKPTESKTLAFFSSVGTILVLGLWVLVELVATFVKQ